MDLTTLTDEELEQLRLDVIAEQNRRLSLVSIPGTMAGLNVQYLEAAGTVQGEAWVQPQGAHDAYPKDWMVLHEEQRWVSLVDANVWEPGVANWRADSGEEWPAWVQPTGAHDAYAIHAKVSHVDKHWTSNGDGNVWEPGVFGWTEAV